MRTVLICCCASRHGHHVVTPSLGLSVQRNATGLLRRRGGPSSTARVRQCDRPCGLIKPPLRGRWWSRRAAKATILRTGRRYRAPALLPCLSDEPEQPMEKDHVADSFGLYFAQAERATPVPVEQLTAACRQSEPIATVIRGSELPSLASLASGFASLQTGKAAGLSGLPPEVYRACPLRQAILYYPVVCKLFLRDPSPFQWRGGLSVCVPKPNKPSTRHQGYRAIMLLEGDNKALQKSMRSALLGAMPTMGVPDQMGGRPG